MKEQMLLEVTSKKFILAFIKKFDMYNIFKYHRYFLSSSVPKPKNFEKEYRLAQEHESSYAWVFTLAFNITPEKLNPYIKNKNYKEISKHLVAFKNENGVMEEFNQKNGKGCVIS
jgi:hypothetical protein